MVVTSRNEYQIYKEGSCKIDEKKKLFFDFFFSNSKLLSNKKLADYLRKLKKQIFLNNICLTSILQEPLNKRKCRNKTLSKD